jgi:hypothetical protein
MIPMASVDIRAQCKPLKWLATVCVLLAGCVVAASGAAATIHFTQRPSYQPSPDGTAIGIVARNFASDCDPASSCGTGYFNAATVQLWAFATPYPTSGQMTTGAPTGGYALATTPFIHYDATTGRSDANAAFVAYSPPPPGTYYLSMLVLGSSGPQGNVVVYDAYNFAGPVVLDSRAPQAPIVSVVEYYNAAFDHYFMTPLPAEIALCDAATPPCAGWTVTGHTFDAFASGAEPDGSVPACRFYNDSFGSKSSHFYALHGGGCEATLHYFPDWQLESADLFAAEAPLPDGTCNSGFVPVFRLYNDGMGGAPNHRFTSDATLRAQMIAAGWIAEGAGSVGVAFCSPQ